MSRGDGTLISVRHREVQAVDVRDVAKLLSRDVAYARTFELDNVRSKPGRQLTDLIERG
jgi:hypothetical protein